MTYSHLWAKAVIVVLWVISAPLCAQGGPQVSVFLRWYPSIVDYPPTLICERFGATVAGRIGVEALMVPPTDGDVSAMWVERLVMQEAGGPHAGQVIDGPFPEIPEARCAPSVDGEVWANFMVTTPSYHNGKWNGQIIYGWRNTQGQPFLGAQDFSVRFNNLQIHPTHVTTEALFVVSRDSPLAERRTVSASFTSAQRKRTNVNLVIYPPFSGNGHEPQALTGLRQANVIVPEQGVTFTWDGLDASGVEVPDGLYPYKIVVSDHNEWWIPELRDDQTASDFVFANPARNGSRRARFITRDDNGNYRYQIAYELGENDRRNLTSRRDASSGEVVMYAGEQATQRWNIQTLPDLAHGGTAAGLRTGSLDEPLRHVLDLAVHESLIPKEKVMSFVLSFEDDRARDEKNHQQKKPPAKVLKATFPNSAFILIVNDDPREPFWDAVQGITGRVGQSFIIKYSSFMRQGTLDVERMLTVGLLNTLNMVEAGRPVYLMFLDHGGRDGDGRGGVVPNSGGPGIALVPGRNGRRIRISNEHIGLVHMAIERQRRTTSPIVVIWFAQCFATENGFAQQVANNTRVKVIGTPRAVKYTSVALPFPVGWFPTVPVDWTILSPGKSSYVKSSFIPMPKSESDFVPCKLCECSQEVCADVGDDDMCEGCPEACVADALRKFLEAAAQVFDDE